MVSRGPTKTRMPPITARAMQTATKVPPRIAPAMAHTMRSTPGFRLFAPSVMAPNTMVRNENATPPYPRPMMVSAP